VCCKVKRNAYFHERTILEPLAIFTWLTFVALVLPADGLNDRSGVALTMVLTAAAYKLVCAEQLPKLSFETALGEYVRGVFFLIWGVCVICCLSYFCVKLDTKVELVAVWLKFDVPYCDELYLPDIVGWAIFLALNGVMWLCEQPHSRFAAICMCPFSAKEQRQRMDSFGRTEREVESAATGLSYDAPPEGEGPTGRMLLAEHSILGEVWAGWSRPHDCPHVE
jgi:hypothetical protein